MKRIILFISLLALILIFCSGCVYISLFESITEAIPILPSDAVLLKAYELDSQTVIITAKGEVFLPGDADLNILKEILGIEGVVEEIGDIAKATLTTVVRDEVTKNKYIPYVIRQVNSPFKIVFGKRDKGQVGSIVIPMGVIKDMDVKK